MADRGDEILLVGNDFQREPFPLDPTKVCRHHFKEGEKKRYSERGGTWALCVIYATNQTAINNNHPRQRTPLSEKCHFK